MIRPVHTTLNKAVDLPLRPLQILACGHEHHALAVGDRAMSMAETISEKNAFSIFGTTTAIMPVWLLLRLAALGVAVIAKLCRGLFDSLAQLSLTFGLSFSAFDTVPIDTRVIRAMSWMVGSLATFPPCV